MKKNLKKKKNLKRKKKKFCEKKFEKMSWKKTLTQEILIIHAECGKILGEFIPQGPHQGSPRLIGMEKERIPKRQERVARPDRVPHHEHGRLLKHPRLPAPRVDMRVIPEEGLKRRGLIPARHQLRVGIPEEAAHVRADKRQAGDIHGQEHRRGHLQVAPLGRVVAGPHGGVALGAGEEGPGEDEGPHFVVEPFEVAVKGGQDVGHAVNVVDLAVLHAAVVDVVLVHRDLGPVKNGRLVHIVPRPGVFEGFPAVQLTIPANKTPSLQKYFTV